ncbi:ankyrin repeat domain-containing protein [Pandoraea pnomenusa]|uniref:ankyrin repeat domain-containing protein n=1 Tax=Pandoraea pnomenusa TaxID=93220 RepID=UPI00333FC085
MFPSLSGGASAPCAEVPAPAVGDSSGADAGQARRRSAVDELRAAFADAPRASSLRKLLWSMGMMPSGKVAAFLEPLLPCDAVGNAILSREEQAALRGVVMLPAADVPIDLLRDAGMSNDAAYDLCCLLHDAPEDIVVSTLAAFAASPSPLIAWWHQTPWLADDMGSREARRSLRVLQLAGHRQWPFDEQIWRSAVMYAGHALQSDPETGMPANPWTGMALLDGLPRGTHAQRLMTTFTGEPILLHAMRLGLPAAAIEKMLSLGFEPDTPSPPGRAPAGDIAPILPGAHALHYAALHGNVEAIGLLISYGAQPDTRDARGYAPMLYAHASAPVLYGCDPSASFLPENRTDRHVRERTAAVVRTFLDLGADPCARGNDGMNVGRALMLSVMASRDGGGLDSWPEFEALLVSLCHRGVCFDAAHGSGARQVEMFAQVHAQGRPGDAIWSLLALLRKLETW